MLNASPFQQNSTPEEPMLVGFMINVSLSTALIKEVTKNIRSLREAFPCVMLTRVEAKRMRRMNTCSPVPLMWMR